MHIILASKSPWRKRLLERHGIRCRIRTSNFQELTHSHNNARQLVIRNAIGKAKEVSRHYPRAIIIGVDTIGVLGKKILGKPANRNHARQMLRSLAGKTHRVITGLCVIDTVTLKTYTTTVTTYVTFRKISPRELERYLNINQWRGKAGAYAIQGAARKFIEKIEGDRTNVVGVPIQTLKNILRKIPNSNDQ